MEEEKAVYMMTSAFLALIINLVEEDFAVACYKKDGQRAVLVKLREVPSSLVWRRRHLGTVQGQAVLTGCAQ